MLRTSVADDLGAAPAAPIRGQPGLVGPLEQSALGRPEARDCVRVPAQHGRGEDGVELHSKEGALHHPRVHGAPAFEKHEDFRRSKTGMTDSTVFRSHSKTTAFRLMARGSTASRISQTSGRIATP